MNQKVKVESLRYDYIEIPPHLEEKYEQDIERNILKGNIPSYHIVSSWLKKQNVKVVLSNGSF